MLLLMCILLAQAACHLPSEEHSLHANPGRGKKRPAANMRCSYATNGENLSEGIETRSSIGGTAFGPFAGCLTPSPLMPLCDML